MKFEKVDPRDIPFNREGRRGRVSYPILKSFLESGIHTARLDRTGIQQSFQSLYSILRQYAQNHHLPVKVFSAGGELYLMRLDYDAEGNPVENWEDALYAPTDGARGSEANIQPAPITPAEVKARAAEERGKTTK